MGLRPTPSTKNDEMLSVSHQLSGQLWSDVSRGDGCVALESGAIPHRGHYAMFMELISNECKS